MESAKETDDDDGNGDDQEEGLDQVLETQKKQKHAPASHRDARPDDAGKDEQKNKANTAASAIAVWWSAIQVGEAQWGEACLPTLPRWQDRRRSKSPLLI